MAHIMVLNDGTTWTDLKGCRIVWVEESIYQRGGSGNYDVNLEEMLKDFKEFEDRGWIELITEFK